ncbi:MAG: hypothetical protein QW303_07120 [Nitrososphaerota archaeon]
MKTLTPSKDSKAFSNTFMASKSKLLHAIFQFFFMSKNDNTKTHYTYFGRSKLKVLFYYLWYLLKKKYRNDFINKNLLKELADEKFIFFPLQTEPERSLLLAAPFQTDQLGIIKNIAKSLPIDYKLYVKEHPTQLVRDWRKTSFYKQIMKLANVKLIHPLVSSEQIIKKCSTVITIGGTAGFEAAFYGKPTISFIKNGYSRLKSVITINNVEELPDTIRRTLRLKVDPDDVSKFVADLEKNSFEFPMSELDIAATTSFFYGGFLVDSIVEISQVKSYFDKYEKEFYILASEHIKKIKQYKT